MKNLTLLQATDFASGWHKLLAWKVSNKRNKKTKETTTKKEEKSGKYGIEVVFVSYQYDGLNKTRQNNNSFPTIAKRKWEGGGAATAPQPHPSAVPDEKLIFKLLFTGYKCVIRQ